MKDKCNNYIAIYTNGKTKCKGSFEFENLPLHKNKSALVVRIALYNYFVKNIPIKDTICNHNNIFDFCIGHRSKGNSKFFYLDKNGTSYDLSKTIRYFISNKGVVIKKKMTESGQISYLNVHPQKGKTWYQTLLNKIDNTDIKNYDINFRYYIVKCKEEIENFKKLEQLF